MTRKHDEATAAVQSLQGRLTQVDQIFRKGRQESDAALQSVESVMDQRLRRSCAESHANVESVHAMAESRQERLRSEVAEATLAAEVAVERRLTQSHNKAFEDLERRLAQVQQELAGKTRALESRLLAEFAACEEGARAAAAQVGTRWCEQLAAVDDGMVRVRADAVQGASETRSFVEQLARDRRESSSRLAALDTSVDDFKNDVGALHREVRELGQAHGAVLATLEQLRCSRGSADMELQAAVRDLRQRLAPVETAMTGLGGDASNSREEARASLSGIRELREELNRRDASGVEMSRQLDMLRREVRETRAEMSAGGDRAAGAERLAHEAIQVQQETTRSQRTWRLEAEEQLRRLAREAAREAAHDTAARDAAQRGEDARYLELSAVVDKLTFGSQLQEQTAARALADIMDRADREGDRVSELSASVDRLHREVRQGDRVDLCAKQIQEDVARRFSEAQRFCDVRLDNAMRMAEQLRVTEGAQRNELWREVREIRGAIGELRLRCGLRGGYGDVRLEYMDSADRDNLCRIAGI